MPNSASPASRLSPPRPRAPLDGRAWALLGIWLASVLVGCVPQHPADAPGAAVPLVEPALPMRADEPTPVQPLADPSTLTGSPVEDPSLPPNRVSSEGAVDEASASELTDEAPAEEGRDDLEAGPAHEVHDTDPSALDDFDEHLGPYGHWEEHPRYGTVWVPHAHVVGSRFAPYVTAGHWAMTASNQWIWVSDYPFGWVTFHYGRWAWGDPYGWVWIPGRQYAPAWVSFRVSSDPYIGWAPMPPRYVWRSGVAVWIGTVPPLPYVFVPSDYFFYPSVYSYVIYQPVRVRHLARRSRLYRPAGAPPGRYYHPPIERIPARARPSGRVRPDERSLSLQRYRVSSRDDTRVRRPAHDRTPTARTLRRSERRADATRAGPQQMRQRGARSPAADANRRVRRVRSPGGREAAERVPTRRVREAPERRRANPRRLEDRQETTTRGAAERRKVPDVERQREATPPRPKPRQVRPAPKPDGARARPPPRPTPPPRVKRFRETRPAPPVRRVPRPSPRRNVRGR